MKIELGLFIRQISAIKADPDKYVVMAFHNDNESEEVMSFVKLAAETVANCLGIKTIQYNPSPFGYEQGVYLDVFSINKDTSNIYAPYEPLGFHLKNGKE